MKNYNSILIKDPDYLVTMDRKRRILSGETASLLIKGNKIAKVGSSQIKADKTIDARGMVVLPGLINTHHHLFQTLFKGIDKLKKQRIIPWVQTMSELADNLNYDAVHTAASIGLAELLLSGCTTCSDMHYMYPHDRNDLFDAVVQAAKEIGIRFHGVRGYMEKGKDDIWPAYITQNDKEILKESERVIDRYHNKASFSMCQVGLGPCGYYSTSKELWKKVCQLARKKGVRLHTHHAESPGEKISLLQSVGSLGSDVWLAHAIYLTDKDIDILNKTKTNISYSPICNMAKKQPAPIIQMAEKGVNIGIGVDGSASNDSSNMLVESRMAGRLQGLNQGIKEASYLRATEILEMATLGGARCLGREKEIGSLEQGKAADIILLDIKNKIECAGAYNPLEAVFHTAINKVDYTIVNGKVIVEKGRLKTVNLKNLIKEQNKIAKRITKKAEKKRDESLSLDWVRFLQK